MSEETERFHIPYPERGIPNWFEQFEDFAANIDSLLFSMMEMSSLVMAPPPVVGSLTAGAVSNTWELSFPLGNPSFVSRTFGSVVTLTTPNGGVDPLVLRNRTVIAAPVPRGPTEDITVEMVALDGSVPIDSAYQVLGVLGVYSGNAMVFWWNGAFMYEDALSLFGMTWPILARGELYLFENAVATTISAVDEWAEVGGATPGEAETVLFDGNGFEVVVAGKYEMTYNVTAVAAAANKDCEFAVGVDFIAPSTGVLDKSVQPRRLDNVISKGTSGGCVLELSAGAKVVLIVRNTTDGSDVTVSHMNFRIKRIG